MYKVSGVPDDAFVVRYLLQRSAQLAMGGDVLSDLFDGVAGSLDGVLELGLALELGLSQGHLHA